MRQLKLALIRHGETAENRRGVIQGQLDTQLNENGRLQIKRLGESFARGGTGRPRPDRIWTSDLQRALDTADAIESYARGGVVRREPRLRERHLGVMQGRSREEVRAMMREGGQTWAQGGESAEEVRARLKDLLAALWQDATDTTATAPQSRPLTVLLFSHGGTLKELCGLLLHARDAHHVPFDMSPDDQDRLSQGFANTGVTLFDCRFIDGRWTGRAVLVNDTSHLDQDTGRDTNKGLAENADEGIGTVKERTKI